MAEVKSKKYLDEEGLKHLISKVALQEDVVENARVTANALIELNNTKQNKEESAGRIDATPGAANHGEVFNHPDNQATGEHSHAEGILTEASGNGSHAEGGASTPKGTRLKGGTASNYGAHAEGAETVASGQFSHAGGRQTVASGICSYTEGWRNKAIGNDSHAEGSRNTAIGVASHAEGSGVQNIYLKGAAGAKEYEICAGLFKNAAKASLLQWKIKNAVKIEFYDGHDEANVVSARCEGDVVYVILDKTLDANNAIDDTSTPCNKYLVHASKGRDSHVEGAGCITVGDGAHAEGDNNSALDSGAHAEGILTVAKNHSAHSEGYSSFAEGNGAHAEGGIYSGSDNGVHCGGHAKGDASHAEGIATIANNTAEHAEGQWNVSNSNTISSIGIGLSDAERKNAFEVMNDGKMYIHGVGDFNGKNPTETNSLQALINNYETRIAKLEAEVSEMLK